MTKQGFKRVFELGVINTIRINYRYFGIKRVFRPLIICSKNMRIEKLQGSVICHSNCIGCVKIGFKEIGVFDPKNERAVWQNKGQIVFKGKASLGSGVRISNGGFLEFGDNMAISGNSSIICSKAVSFGNDCLVSWDCLFMDTDLHSVINDIGDIVNAPKSICVGNHVWFGNRCLVLKGATIYDNNIVAAGTVLAKSVEESNCIIASNKILKRNINWVK